ncbi:MAG: DUF4256 domain-containing protein [Bacteroidota bacterium]|nr:DUF4256 domain-containing protein [Bacteroidota bacterium]
MTKQTLLPKQQEDLLTTLKTRFEKNMNRHQSLKWENIQAKLLKNPDKLWSLSQMEETGGEPDLVVLDVNSDAYIFYDCSPESPKGRRSICYDHVALLSRKEHPPKNSALNMAKEMGIELINEQQYFELQKFGKFDTKTSTWLKTTEELRALGGAIFGDWRYGRVFIYHNGAESYYGSRGFRGFLSI